VDIKEIKTIIDLMKKNDLDVFKLENEGFKITLKKNQGNVVVAHSSGPAPASAPAASGADTAPAPAPAAESAAPGVTIDSPMVGTFYRSPSPDSASYVEVGAKVTPDTVVCIIEAMKVMNEIKAEKAGVIAEIRAENGKPVQFGEPLFVLK